MDEFWGLRTKVDKQKTTREPLRKQLGVNEEPSQKLDTHKIQQDIRKQKKTIRHTQHKSAKGWTKNPHASLGKEESVSKFV